MMIIDAAMVAAAATPQRLVPALERMFREGCTMPARQHHEIPVTHGTSGTLLLMPAWRTGAYLGVKLVSVFPSNAARGLPAVSAGYVLMDASTGAVLAMIDGTELTAKRTAATSALAARFLMRPAARSLLIVGSGRIARELARWHCALNPNLQDISLWGRTPAHAVAAAGDLCRLGLSVRVAADLIDALAQADVIAAATLTTTPLVLGAHIRPGTHVDLVGGFTPQMREADDELIGKSRIFVDTFGALEEAGDLTVPVVRGIIATADVVELGALCRRSDSGRRSDSEITVFKSVGSALEDLAAAIAVYEFAADVTRIN
jgi:ornithine cyclodeaminase